MGMTEKEEIEESTIEISVSYVDGIPEEQCRCEHCYTLILWCEECNQEFGTSEYGKEILCISKGSGRIHKHKACPTGRRNGECDAAFVFRLMAFGKGTPEHEKLKDLVNAAEEVGEAPNEQLHFRDGSILVRDGDEIQVWEPEED